VPSGDLNLRFLGRKRLSTEQSWSDGLHSFCKLVPRGRTIFKIGPGGPSPCSLGCLVGYVRIRPTLRNISTFAIYVGSSSREAKSEIEAEDVADARECPLAVPCARSLC
jgi:hypothetical protein